MIRCILACILAACFITADIKAQHVDAAALDTLFNRLERHNKAMGSMLLSKNGKILYQRGFGQARTGKMTGIANKPATVYRIGSITKMYTAAMIFRMIEEHRLKLTDTLAKWFPQLPDAGRITIDQMLTHHSGLHNFTQDTTFMAWQDTPRTKEQIIARIAVQQPDFVPGSKAEYSNTNFIVLGYIIEQITGMPYSQNLRLRLTGPLKLNSTAFGTKIRPEEGEALPYAMEDGAWTAVPPSDAGVAGGAGGIASNVGDMAKFIEALFLHKYMSDASLKTMMTLKDDYGRGMIRFPFYDRFAYGHNGHIDNFTTTLGFFPKDSLVLSIACNAVNYNFNDILIGVLSIYYGRPYKMPDFSKTVAVTATKLKQLEGVYTSKEIGMDITITATETGITAQATGQSSFPLDAVSATEFANDGVGIRLNFAVHGNEPAAAMTVAQGGGIIPFVRKN